MTASLLLLLALSATPASPSASPGASQGPSQGATGCWSACQRHVQDSAVRGRVCRVCITTGRSDGWLQALTARPEPTAPLVLRSALADPDWRVRWGALRARARLQGLTESRVLAEWVGDASSSDELLACLTAARAAAAAGSSPAAFLQDAGARSTPALARISSQRDAVRRALELEVYAEDASLRGEALLHLSLFLGQTPARVLLEAMSRRPAAADAAAASALLWVAERQHTSVGRMLVHEARPKTQALINRLFGVYSQDLEKLQPGMASVEAATRRTTVQTLGLYGPLARRELERALGDADLAVRQGAARALAESDGLSPPDAVRRWLHGTNAGSALQRPWWELAAADPACEPLLLELAHDAQLAPASRGEAVAWLAECAGPSQRRFDEVSAFLTDAAPPVRAGAVRALAQPRSALGDSAVAAALEDPAPEVVAAALAVVGEHRQRARAEDVVALLDAASPDVRRAASDTLGQLGRPQDVKPLARVLAEDRAAPVRVAAAEALILLGGPLAAAALSQAVARDPDSHVQHVARRGMDRLGFTPPLAGAE